MLKKEVVDATNDKIDNKQEKFWAMCFILRSTHKRYMILLDDRKRSSSLGRDKYQQSLTEVFNSLVRDSGEYDGVRRPYNPSFERGHGGRGRRGRDGFMLAQQGCGG